MTPDEAYREDIRAWVRWYNGLKPIPWGSIGDVEEFVDLVLLPHTPDDPSSAYPDLLFWEVVIQQALEGNKEPLLDKLSLPETVRHMFADIELVRRRPAHRPEGMADPDKHVRLDLMHQEYLWFRRYGLSRPQALRVVVARWSERRRNEKGRPRPGWELMRADLVEFQNVIDGKHTAHTRYRRKVR